MFNQCAHAHQKKEKRDVKELELKQTVYALIIELILEIQKEWEARWNEPMK